MMLGRRLNRLFPERRPTATERDALKVEGPHRRTPASRRRLCTDGGRGARRRRPSGARPTRAFHGAVRGAPLRRAGRGLGHAGLGAQPAAGTVEACRHGASARGPAEPGLAYRQVGAREHRSLGPVADRAHGLHRPPRRSEDRRRREPKLRIKAATPEQTGRHAVGRQPAEGRARQASRHRCPDPSFLRSDARRRCRRPRPRSST